MRAGDVMCTLHSFTAAAAAALAGPRGGRAEGRGDKVG